MTFNEAMESVDSGKRVKIEAIEVFRGDGDIGHEGMRMIRRVRNGLVIIEEYKPIEREVESEDWVVVTDAKEEK